MKKPLYILDGYSIIYRSYFAFIRQPIINPAGDNMSAVFGFFRMLYSFFDKYSPEEFIVAMDPPTKTFRHEMYDQYKANRDKTPDDLHAQVPLINELLHLAGIEARVMDGYEADDVMGSLAVKADSEGRPCFIISGDKDLLQLVGGNIKILKPEKGSFIEMDESEVLNDRGVRPDQIIDYLSLIGDSADNIPGVAGIGPKTAVSLLSEYESLDNIYANLDSMKKSAKKTKLENGRESAFFSRELVIIKKDLEVPECQTDVKANPFALANRFKELGLNSLFQDTKRIFHLEEQGELFSVEKMEKEPDPSAEKGKYTAITDETELNRWMEKIKKAGMAAVDCETDSLDSLSARLIGISFSIKSGEACYIPVSCQNTNVLPEETIKNAVRELLEDPGFKIIGQNFKYDLKVLYNWGISVHNVFFDTMIAGWMLDSASLVNMDYLAERYLSYRTIHFKDIVAKGDLFDSIELDKAVEYAAEDADITFRLFELFESLLKERGLYQLFRLVEMPLLVLLAKMEIQGIGLDAGELKTFGIELSDELSLIEQEIYELCGHEFNINSTKQLQEVLFDERKLTPIKKTKTGYSTDIGVLQQLASEDPVPEKILIYRGLAKLKSTYVDTLPEMINPETGRIHTHYLQNGTETGRLSSKDPNLQNIPVRDDNGRRIRSAFKPAPGYVFLSADYSQIELVVLAHLSGDPGLTQAFQSGSDIHRQTAALIFNCDEDQVEASQRRVAKTINFGVMYGMSAFRLSNELKIPRKEASEFIRLYFERFSGIRSFIDSTVKLAEEEGGVYTLLKRFRPLPGINSKNKMEKSGAERAAVNSRIQGSAADIVKMAMLNIQKRLEYEKLDSRMLLQVHDECVLEVPEAEIETVKVLLEEEMTSVYSLSVPLKVSIEQGSSWGEIH